MPSKLKTRLITWNEKEIKEKRIIECASLYRITKSKFEVLNSGAMNIFFNMDSILKIVF